METSSTRTKPTLSLLEELKSDKLLPGLATGVLAGIVGIFMVLSFASLIFSGELQPYSAYGIGMALFSTIVSMIVTGLLTSGNNIISIPQDGPAVIIAVAMGELVAILMQEPDMTDTNLIMTVLLMISTTTIATGLALFFMGKFNLGRLTRFLPYPVLGGFIAGLGWLLFVGSIGVTASTEITLETLPVLVQTEELIRWFPGIVLGATLFIAAQKSKHFLTLPLIIFGTIFLFHIILLLTGTSLAEAGQMGLLINGGVIESIWQPLTPRVFEETNWSVISRAFFRFSGHISTMIVLSATSLLLNSSGIELATKQNLDLNQELKATGIANLLSGLGGGMVNYSAISLSILSNRSGGRGKLPGIVGGIIVGLIFFFGTPLLRFVPNALLGSMLVFLGIDFLYDWLIGGWKKLNRLDFGVAVLIVIIIAVKGFIIGVGAGVFIMLVLFTIKYSQVDMIHHEFNGAQIQSNYERNAHSQHHLLEAGNQIYVMELQGYIFFGTADTLLTLIRQQIELKDGQPPIKYIIIDFERVTGLDSSAALSFAKGEQFARKSGVTLILSSVSDDILRQINENEMISENGHIIDIFPDLDHALEWCEDQLLINQPNKTMISTPKIHWQLRAHGLTDDEVERLLTYLDRKEVQKGEYLIRKGDEDHNMYFVEKGQLSIYGEGANGLVRLLTIGYGTVVGEFSLYRNEPRTASVIADKTSKVYQLSQQTLKRMEKEDPALAVAFHFMIAHVLSDRLAAKTRAFEALR